MCDHDSRMSGPDFLDAVATAELANGNGVNADAYQQRAHEWRQLQADHERAQQRIVEQQQTLDRIRKQITAVAA